MKIVDPHIVFISNKEEGKTVKNIESSEFSEFADQVAHSWDQFGFVHSTRNFLHIMSKL